MNRFKQVPIGEQDPENRIKNFNEVCLGYTEQEMLEEAKRCLNCKDKPCTKGCPVSIQIPDFIQSLLKKDYVGAARIIAQDSALPAVCGRVCPQEHLCEGNCVLAKKGDPVAIGKLERFVGDKIRELNIDLTLKQSAKKHKVAVVGSGPAGLTCAGDLAKMGYSVTIFESLHKPGGVLTYGIPEFRLPDYVVEYEIENLMKLGVKIETNVIIGKTLTIDQLFDQEGFDAVFLGTGAGLPKFPGIPGENLNGVYSANEYLARVNLMHAYSDEYATPIKRGKVTVVVGGGNVAMDASRTALRLGSETHIVYRRSEAELPARSEEVLHAKEEGVHFWMLSNPVEILGDQNGWVRGVKCIRMELGQPDSSGRRSPIPIANSEFTIDADIVIFAIGTTPNPLVPQTTKGLEHDSQNRVKIDPQTGATSREGVFAAGDVVSGSATVIEAMGNARKTALAIHRYLMEKG